MCVLFRITELRNFRKQYWKPPRSVPPGKLYAPTELQKKIQFPQGCLTNKFKAKPQGISTTYFNTPWPLASALFFFHAHATTRRLVFRTKFHFKSTRNSPHSALITIGIAPILWNLPSTVKSQSVHFNNIIGGRFVFASTLKSTTVPT